MLLKSFPSIMKIAGAEISFSQTMRHFDNLNTLSGCVQKLMCECSVFASIFSGPRSDERFFARLCVFIRLDWQSYEDIQDQGFDSFLNGAST
jgi:hypothetical protein